MRRLVGSISRKTGRADIATGFILFREIGAFLQIAAERNIVLSKLVH
jgi:hypothetical protein